MSKTYVFHSDPGHGWVQVPMTELLDLGIAHKISSYSYMKGCFAYLEEDCDMAHWWHARIAIDGKKPDLRDIHKENTPIRSYERFDPSALHLL